MRALQREIIKLSDSEGRASRRSQRFNAKRKFSGWKQKLNEKKLKLKNKKVN